jgi:hypothetical protein
LAKAKAFTKEQLLLQISDLLASVPDGETVTTTKLREMTDLSRNSVEWAALKKHGVAETSGGLHTAVIQLLSGLASRRLHVVPVGELEGWFRSATGKGGAHVAQVLDGGLHMDSERNQDIRKFAGGVIDSLS